MNQFHKIFSSIVLVTFISTTIVPPQYSYAQLVPTAQINLPVPGTTVDVSNVYAPTLIKGLTVDQTDPFKFEFLMDTGDSGLQGDALQAESYKLIKYFMASLANPEKDMWVNLSPYEKDRIIPDVFGKTEMGRDLLAQDYILKQLTATLMSPDGETGKKFWERIYEKVYASSILHLASGKDESPNANDQMLNAMNTFNKVWIVPQTGYFYEHDNSVFIVDAKLKVMLEEDYVAYQKTLGAAEYGLDSRKDSGMSEDTKQIIREEIIPMIEQEVNEGENFANLRQIYNAMLLSVWFKKRLKDHILGQAYADKEQISSISLNKSGEIEGIWNQYVEAFKVGVYNTIKEEYDPQTQTVVPRKYFSGGAKALTFENAQQTANAMLVAQGFKNGFKESIRFQPGDRAMMDEALYSKALMEWLEEYNPSLKGSLYHLDLNELKQKVKEMGGNVKAIFRMAEHKVEGGSEELTEYYVDSLPNPFGVTYNLATEIDITNWRYAQLLLKKLMSVMSKEDILKNGKDYKRESYYEAERILQYLLFHSTSDKKERKSRQPTITVSDLIGMLEFAARQGNVDISGLFDQAADDVSHRFDDPDENNWAMMNDFVVERGKYLEDLQNAISITHKSKTISVSIPWSFFNPGGVYLQKSFLLSPKLTVGEAFSDQVFFLKMGKNFRKPKDSKKFRLFYDLRHDDSGRVIESSIRAQVLTPYGQWEDKYRTIFEIGRDDKIIKESIRRVDVHETNAKIAKIFNDRNPGIYDVFIPRFSGISRYDINAVDESEGGGRVAHPRLAEDLLLMPGVTVKDVSKGQEISLPMEFYNYDGFNYKLFYRIEIGDNGEPKALSFIGKEPIRLYSEWEWSDAHQVIVFFNSITRNIERFTPILTGTNKNILDRFQDKTPNLVTRIPLGSNSIYFRQGKFMMGLMLTPVETVKTAFPGQRQVFSGLGWQDPANFRVFYVIENDDQGNVKRLSLVGEKMVGEEKYEQTHVIDVIFDSQTLRVTRLEKIQSGRAGVPGQATFSVNERLSGDYMVKRRSRDLPSLIYRALKEDYGIEDVETARSIFAWMKKNQAPDETRLHSYRYAQMVVQKYYEKFITANQDLDDEDNAMMAEDGKDTPDERPLSQEELDKDVAAAILEGLKIAQQAKDATFRQVTGLDPDGVPQYMKNNVADENPETYDANEDLGRRVRDIGKKIRREEDAGYGEDGSMDNAMLKESKDWTQGGVNLRSDQADIQIQTSENGFKFPKLDPAMLNGSWGNMTPVILDIAPMPKAEVLDRLGLARTSPDPASAGADIPSEKSREPEMVVLN